MSDNILGMMKLFQTCDGDKVALATFLIFEPEEPEVPSIPGESTVIVTRKITEMFKQLDILMEQNFSKSKHVTAEYIFKPSYAVIVKNLPSNLAKIE